MRIFVVKLSPDIRDCTPYSKYPTAKEYESVNNNSSMNGFHEAVNFLAEDGLIHGYLPPRHSVGIKEVDQFVLVSITAKGATEQKNRIVGVQSYCEHHGNQIRKSGTTASKKIGLTWDYTCPEDYSLVLSTPVEDAREIILQGEADWRQGPTIEITLESFNRICDAILANITDKVEKKKLKAIQKSALEGSPAKHQNQQQHYVVLTENDESPWSDETGKSYHFPKRYASLIQPGQRIVYYKGKLKNTDFKHKRLSDEPHYFGMATIGKVSPDKDSNKGDLKAKIVDFQPFAEAVLAKQNGEFLEEIPATRITNYWRDGVREISKDVFDEIIYQAGLLPSDEDDLSLESGTEGDKKLRYVTTYERSPLLRKQAIAYHKPVCKACGFDFGKVYGEFAAGYIHIHHIVPISQRGGKVKVDPKTDLVPLCANCHAVVHLKKNDTLSIDDICQLINIINK